MDGRILWQVKNGAAWTATGPAGARGTPTIDGDRLYHENAHDEVVCLDAKTGQKIWEREPRPRIPGQTRWIRPWRVAPDRWRPRDLFSRRGGRHGGPGQADRPDDLEIPDRQRAGGLRLADPGRVPGIADHAHDVLQVSDRRECRHRRPAVAIRARHPALRGQLRHAHLPRRPRLHQRRIRARFRAAEDQRERRQGHASTRCGVPRTSTTAMAA